jgi:hypothetical protein
MKSVVCNLLLIALVLSCTRKDEEKSSVSLKLSLPGSHGTMSSSEMGVRHLAVNVSGPGQDYFYEWDAHASGEAAPTTLSITLDPGQHLIQVAAYVATATGGGFYYGDQNLNLNGGNKSVAISTSPIGSSSGMNARVYGRYISSPLYSGSVTGYFFPPGGKPAMPILSTEMYAGWFNFFAIDGVTFKYVHDVSGTVLFNSIDVVSGASPEILVNGASVKGVSGNRLVQVYVPNHYRGSGGVANTSEVMDSAVSLMGFFGSVPALKEACIQGGPSGTYNSGSYLL